jgi:hypothetical protein
MHGRTLVKMNVNGTSIMNKTSERSIFGKMQSRQSAGIVYGKIVENNLQLDRLQLDRLQGESLQLDRLQGESLQLDRLQGEISAHKNTPHYCRVSLFRIVDRSNYFIGMTMAAVL